MAAKNQYRAGRGPPRDESPVVVLMGEAGLTTGSERPHSGLPWLPVWGTLRRQYVLNQKMHMLIMPSSRTSEAEGAD